MTIVGSTYAFGVDRRSDHFLVEDSVWTQDDSGYAEDESGYSGRVDLTPKPGRMWNTVPWGVAHHGSRAYLNGGLIGSLGTPGSIVVRHNIVRNAYNGVRIRANRCDRPPCNVNVEIYDNDFQFVRDNPVEPEDEATNWWVFHNRIYNAHGWFSLDGVGGGPVYIFGNVGWFDEKLSRRCIQRDWAGDRTFQAGGSYAPTSENECSRSRTGKVVKLGPGPIELKEPIYAFNNSWYVRAPVVDGGTTKFRAWNNASLFCEPNVAAPGMCVSEFNTEKSCVQSMPDGTTPYANGFPVDLDRVPFVDCFATSPGDVASHGISNHPDFPDKLVEAGYPLGGLHGDPGFINAAAGNFRLRPDSLARGKGCLVARAQDGSLTCGPSGNDGRPGHRRLSGRRSRRRPGLFVSRRRAAARHENNLADERWRTAAGSRVFDGDSGPAERYAHGYPTRDGRHRSLRALSESTGNRAGLPLSGAARCSSDDCNASCSTFRPEPGRKTRHAVGRANVARRISAMIRSA